MKFRVVKVPQGDTITIRIPDSKTTESNEINLYIDDKPVTTLNDEDSRVTIEKDGQTDNYVVISDAKPEDVGRYTAEFNGKLQPLCMLEVTPGRPKKIRSRNSSKTRMWWKKLLRKKNNHHKKFLHMKLPKVIVLI